MATFSSAGGMNLPADPNQPVGGITKSNQTTTDPNNNRRLGRSTVNAARVTGVTMQVRGQALQVGGRGISVAGRGLMAAGGALSATGAGALVGVPLKVAGGALTGGGLAVGGVGKVTKTFGKKVSQKANKINRRYRQEDTRSTQQTNAGTYNNATTNNRQSAAKLLNSAVAVRRQLTSRFGLWAVWSSWLFIQLPLAFLYIGALTTALVFSTETTSEDGLITRVFRAGVSALNTITSFFSAGTEQMAFGLFLLMAFIIFMYNLLAFLVVVALLGQRAVFGRWCGTKLSLISLALASSVFPVVNAFPIIQLYATLAILSPDDDAGN